MTKNDSFDLSRFVKAQKTVYEAVIDELRQGEKRSHWIWFIFPQIRGLGFSSQSQTYAIQSNNEAIAYLAHPILGARLRECCSILLAIQGKTIDEIMGSPDNLKLRSSMTLFASVSENVSPFREILDKYYQGKTDRKTLWILRSTS